LSGGRFLAIQPAVENGIWGQKRYMKNEREEGKGREGKVHKSLLRII